MSGVPNFEESTSEFVNDESLQTITSLANKQLVLEARVADLENALEDAKEELRVVQTEQFPEALIKAGVSEFRLLDGRRVSMKQIYAANIKPEYKEAAFNWLREHGHDDIIKNNLILSFGRGEDNLFKTVSTQLMHMGLGKSMSHKEEVHWQTLRAFVKEQMESGVDIPTQEFGVHVFNKTEIKETR